MQLITITKLLTLYHRYHCERDVYIVRCAVQGACSTIEECVVRCIDGQYGASCEPVSNGAEGKREVLTIAGEVSSSLERPRRQEATDDVLLAWTNDANMKYCATLTFMKYTLMLNT